MSTTALRVTVVGVGGGGGHVVRHLATAGMNGVDLVAVSADVDALASTGAAVQVVLPRNPSVHACSGDAAEATRGALTAAVGGAEVVFVVAGMGGCTATGAAPVVAELARRSGAITIAVVTKPFLFEGSRRNRRADEGIAALRGAADHVFVIANEPLLTAESLADGFRRADDAVLRLVRAVIAGDVATASTEDLLSGNFAALRASLLERSTRPE